jgi:hypothetical protein
MLRLRPYKMVFIHKVLLGENTFGDCGVEKYWNILGTFSNIYILCSTLPYCWGGGWGGGSTYILSPGNLYHLEWAKKGDSLSKSLNIVSHCIPFSTTKPLWCWNRTIEDVWCPFDTVQYSAAPNANKNILKKYPSTNYKSSSGMVKNRLFFIDKNLVNNKNLSIHVRPSWKIHL